MVFSGLVPYFDASLAGMKVCGIIACTNESLSSCTEILEPNNIIEPITFTHVSLSLSNIEDNTFFMPITRSGEFTPLSATDFSYSSHSLSMNLTNPIPNLRTFAILGRTFELDTK